MGKSLAICVLVLAAVAVADPFADVRRMIERNQTLTRIAEQEALINEKYLHDIERMVKPMKVCPPISRGPPPKSISQLHPYDIGAIGAIGDSISQGCNAKSTSVINHINYVGVTWSIGGDAGVTTLYNLLTPYSGLIPAASYGQGADNTGLNCAKDGAVASDMPTQATDLVEKFRNANYPDGQNFLTAWKVATVLIGGNNFCKICQDQENNSVARFVMNMKATLDKLMEVPRLLVNILPMIDIGPLASFRSGITCDVVLNQVCPCVMSESGRAVIADFTAQYNAALVTLVKDYEQHHTKNFAAVIQPFLTKTRIPDRNYISPADCFHPSLLGQQSFAIALWNNMLTPAHLKATTFTPGEEPMCPTEHTLFYIN
jgi:phospholipase B1